MSNPLSSLFNGNQPNALPNGFGNLSNFMTNFNNFRQMLGNNPGQNAEQIVKNMVSSGRVSQEQLNQASQMATMIQKVTGL